MSNPENHPLVDFRAGVLILAVMRYVSAVGMVILLYDYILTMKVEVSCDRTLKSFYISPANSWDTLDAISLARGPLFTKTPLLPQSLRDHYRYNNLQLSLVWRPYDEGGMAQRFLELSEFRQPLSNNVSASYS